MTETPQSSNTRPALRWQRGEQDAFRATLFPEEFSFYVSDGELARLRDDAASISTEEWEAELARGGYYVNACVAYAPRGLVLSALERRSAANPETNYRLAGALAVLGLDIVPVMLRQLETAISNIGNGVYAGQIDDALDDLAPVSAPDAVLPVAGVLTSKANSRTKDRAVAWLRRHTAVAVPSLVAALVRAADREAATHALTAIASLEIVAQVRAAARELPPADAARVEALVAKTASGKSATSPPAAPGYAHVGYVCYEAHAAAPLVLGDLDVMKDWRGDPDGGDATGTVTLPRGEVAICDLDLHAPDVFLAASRREVVLLAMNDTSLREQLADDELARAVGVPLAEVFGTVRIAIRSGALVIAIRYNATPVEGADVRGLDERVFHDANPRLPVAPPTTPHRADELLVLPVLPGTYELHNGRSDGLAMCRLRWVHA